VSRAKRPSTANFGKGGRARNWHGSLYRQRLGSGAPVTKIWVLTEGITILARKIVTLARKRCTPPLSKAEPESPLWVISGHYKRWLGRLDHRTARPVDKQTYATGLYCVLITSKDWRFGAISRADVADFLVRQINDRALIGTTPLLISWPARRTKLVAQHAGVITGEALNVQHAT